MVLDLTERTAKGEGCEGGAGRRCTIVVLLHAAFSALPKSTPMVQQRGSTLDAVSGNTVQGNTVQVNTVRVICCLQFTGALLELGLVSDEPSDERPV